LITQQSARQSLSFAIRSIPILIELHLIRVGSGKSPAVIVGVAAISIGLLWMLLLLLIGKGLLLIGERLIDEGLLLRIEDELLELSCCHWLKTRQKRHKKCLPPDCFIH
jgi:hypothetical protein